MAGEVLSPWAVLAAGGAVIPKYLELVVAVPRQILVQEASTACDKWVSIDARRATFYVYLTPEASGLIGRFAFVTVQGRRIRRDGQRGITEGRIVFDARETDTSNPRHPDNAPQWVRDGITKVMAMADGSHE